METLFRQFLDYDENNRSRYAEEFAQKYLGKGQRTLYRYMKSLRGSQRMGNQRRVRKTDKNYDYYQGTEPMPEA